MSLRTLLIVHEEGALQRLLKSYILAEMDDVAVAEAFSYKQAMEMLEHQSFVTVICSGTISGKESRDVQEKMKTFPKNASTPLIFVSYNKDKTSMEYLTKPGTEHSLVFPFSPQELSTKINLVSAVSTRRISERVYVIDSTAILHLGMRELEVGVLNMSFGGVLCDYGYKPEYSDVFNVTSISLYFPEMYNHAALAQIPCRMLYTNVLSWGPSNIPKYVRTAFEFSPLSRGYRNVLNKIFESAQNELELLLKEHTPITN